MDHCIKVLIFFVFLFLRQTSSTTATDIEETVKDQVKQLKSEYNTLNRRVGFLEIENKDQKEDIQFLNAKLSQITQNDAIMKILRNQGENIDDIVSVTRLKRPARLFPESILRGSKKEQYKPFIGLPSSCEDLQKIGHTLNAIYMVKGPNGSKIKTVFCNFQTAESRKHSSLSYSTLLENDLGNIDVKSASGVYFYAQVLGIQSIADNGVILFNKERLNIGGGMNIKSGVFTAPKTGTYAFSFSILKNGFNAALLYVYIRRNSTRIGVGVAGGGLIATPITQQPILKLVKGDRVDLQKGQSGELSECYIRESCHHFSGWLLEEDLEL